MILHLLWILLISLNVAKANDIIAGFAQLGEPCFPVYSHPRCKTLLWEAHNFSKESAPRNTPETKVFLFTPSSQDKAEQLHKCAGGLSPESTFNTSCPTEVFIHGYIDGLCRTAWMREVKEQLYQRSDCYNVILVDWTWGNSLDDATSIINFKIVGAQIAYVLKKISRQKDYECKNFHVIGSSYGATCGSYAGKNMKGKCRLGRLTALDHALTPFKNSPKSQRLNQKDAIFVDVLHTNGGLCSPPNYGDIRPSGHVDFYFNAGTFQEKSCLPYAITSMLKLDIIYGLVTAIMSDVCAHAMAIQYYKTSILAGRDHSEMVGVRCKSYGDFASGECSMDCTIPGNCLVSGMDTPLYINTTDLGPSDQKGRIYFVPISESCPYNDHSGFTGLPLKPFAN